MKNKSVLVIDTPKTCEECIFCGRGGRDLELYVCSVTFDYEEEPKMFTCPLKPLPRKIDIKAQEDIDDQRFDENPDAKRLADEIVESQGHTRIGSTRDIYHAWNACLKEITGETE